MGGGFVRTDYKIEPGEIIVSAVTTTAIASLAVTTTKIALSAVTSAQIGANAIFESAIQDAVVTTTKIATSAVTQDKIETSAITLDNLIALGSYAGALGAGGIIEIAHGLVTGPAAAWATPLAADGLTAWGRRIGLVGITTTNVTFVVASATVPVTTVSTCVLTLIASTNTTTFIWGAHI